ncbi:hypothetical protein [Altererythrobacter lauratis]|uniref:Uncharacterized protein n=1 Tax=Alteraurantiacibacter lauratis TaxID=2054627 RepID=A0ABV7EGQ8_9SPHN
MSEDKKTTPHVPQAFIDLIGDHFLEAARYLREIQDEYPDEFIAVAKSLGIKRRKAYHLASVDRSFDNLGVAQDRLRKIGWTKLSLLAPHVDADNVLELLNMAEVLTAYELKMYLRGEMLAPDTRAVVVYLDKAQYAVFESAVLKAGAIKHPHGLTNKEAALTHALTSYLSTEG